MLNAVRDKRVLSALILLVLAFSAVGYTGYQMGVQAAPPASNGWIGDDLNVRGRVYAGDLRLGNGVAGRIPYLEGDLDLGTDSGMTWDAATNTLTVGNLTVTSHNWAERPSEYTVYYTGSTYIAVNGRTGATTTNANAATLINACISTLTAGRTWIETVHIKGNVTISSDIVLADYTRVIVSGKLTLASATNNKNVFTLTNIDYAEICGGGTVDGNRAGVTGTSSCIYATNPTYLSIHDLTIRNAEDHNIYLDNLSHLTAYNLILRDAGKFNFYTTSGAWCYDLQASNIKGIGSGKAGVGGSESNLLFSKLRYSSLSNLYAEDAYTGAGAGIDINTCEHVTGSNLQAYNNGYCGIEFNNVDFSSFTGLSSYLNTGDGISVHSGSYHTSLIGGVSRGNKATGLYALSANNIVVSGISFYDNSGLLANSRSGVELVNSTDCRIVDCNFWNVAAPAQMQYGVEEIGTSNANEVYNCRFSNLATAPVLLIGATTKARGSYGYVTENTGIATITAGANQVVINHGLGYTPSIQHFTLMRTGALTNCTAVWLDAATITSTQITLKCGTSAQKKTDGNITVPWTAQRLP